jgi:chromosome segregation ATPase
LEIKQFKIFSLKYNDFLFKRIKIEKNRLKIEEIILRLDFRKKKILNLAFKKVHNSFKTIFHAMVPKHTAIIKTKKNKLKKLIVIKFKIVINDSQKGPSELS